MYEACRACRFSCECCALRTDRSSCSSCGEHYANFTLSADIILCPVTGEEMQDAQEEEPN